MYAACAVKECLNVVHACLRISSRAMEAVYTTRFRLLASFVLQSICARGNEQLLRGVKDTYAVPLAVRRRRQSRASAAPA
jgi:hypothetical protein